MGFQEYNALTILVSCILSLNRKKS
jgi:hypothetical protein